MEKYTSDALVSGREIAAGFPRLLEHYDAKTNDDSKAVSEKSFEFGLKTVLDGLAARIPGSP